MTQAHHDGSINARVRWATGEDAERQVARGGTADGVFVSAAWVWSAWRNLAELGCPLLLIVDLGPDMWWLPLAERRGELRLAGSPLGDRHDLAGPGGPGRAGAAAAMLHALTERTGGVELHALASAGALADALRGHGGWAVEPESSPLIPTTAAPSPGARRRMRRLERLGPTRVEIQGYPRLDEDGVRAFADARREVWRAHGRGSPTVELLPGFGAFLRDSVTGLARAEFARLWQLHVGEVVVAQDLHLGPPAAPLLYMRAYDPAWAALSPGRVLLEQTLHLLHRQDVAVLDSGRGDEPYKLALGGDTSTVSNAALRRSLQIRR
ncbi:MAG: GNAT family N-acetyltransferase [Pseudonocardiales bacterium]